MWYFSVNFKTSFKVAGILSGLSRKSEFEKIESEKI